MNLLIVEDEVRLRNALANNIPWDKHGIEVVGQAGNGLEALRLINRKKPEIILLDLQMPASPERSCAQNHRAKWS
jgi:two-component system response regulator YesN